MTMNQQMTPKEGEVTTKNGKEYKWVGSQTSGYWSQIRALKPVNETFCPACSKVREKDNPTLVLNGREEVFYRIYGMCSECYEHVNSHREKFLTEFEQVEKIKKQYNKQDVE